MSGSILISIKVCFIYLTYSYSLDIRLYSSKHISANISTAGGVSLQIQCVRNRIAMNRFERITRKYGKHTMLKWTTDLKKERSYLHICSAFSTPTGKKRKRNFGNSNSKISSASALNTKDDSSSFPLEAFRPKIAAWPSRPSFSLS